MLCPIIFVLLFLLPLPTTLALITIPIHNHAPANTNSRPHQRPLPNTTATWPQPGPYSPIIPTIPLRIGNPPQTPPLNMYVDLSSSSSVVPSSDCLHQPSPDHEICAGHNTYARARSRQRTRTSGGR